MDSWESALPAEFRHAAALDAARALVHRWLAAAEREPPQSDLAAGVFAEGAPKSGSLGAFDATFVSFAPAAGGGLELEFTLGAGRLVVVHRDGVDGGRLTRADVAASASSPAPGAQTWARNRVRSFAHRWLWTCARGEDAALRDLIATRDDESLASVRSNVASLGAGRCALRTVALDVRGERYDASAEIDWRGRSRGGTPLRARMRQRWWLRESEGPYPLLERSSLETIHPLEPDVPERSEEPERANAPSDDAESGGA